MRHLAFFITLAFALAGYVTSASAITIQPGDDVTFHGAGDVSINLTYQIVGDAPDFFTVFGSVAIFDSLGEVKPLDLSDAKTELYGFRLTDMRVEFCDVCSGLSNYFFTEVDYDLPPGTYTLTTDGGAGALVSPSVGPLAVSRQLRISLT